MNRLAFFHGYLMGKAAEDVIDTPPVVIPETPEEAQQLAMLDEIQKHKDKEEKKKARKDIKIMDAQIAAMRALKKKKEALLYT